MVWRKEFLYRASFPQLPMLMGQLLEGAQTNMQGECTLYALGAPIFSLNCQSPNFHLWIPKIVKNVKMTNFL